MKVHDIYIPEWYTYLHAMQILKDRENQPAEEEKDPKIIFPSDFSTKFRKDDLQDFIVMNEEPEPPSILTNLPPPDDPVEFLASSIINKILFQAIDARASDIHIESLDRVRFRVDGLMREQKIELPINRKKMFLGIVNRIKVMAKMDIAEKRRPQDGAFSQLIQEKGSRGKIEIRFRAATYPSIDGESVALRILDPRKFDKNIAQLGHHSQIVEFVNGLRQFKTKNQLVVVTAPTGNGKTTTLYAMLRSLMSDTNRIMTLEDPIEYRIPGISQVQIEDHIDVGFHNMLRSYLRADPNIVLIGELRDEESTRIAIQAAMSGTMILTTLHTSDAVNAIGRLINLGVPPIYVAATLRGVLSQRLVRSVCQHCRQPYQPEQKLLNAFFDKNVPEQDFYHGAGCSKCDYTGYSDRIPVSELIVIDDIISDMVAKEKSPYDILQYCQEQEMVTMKIDAETKLTNGYTTIEEIFRCVPLPISAKSL